MVRLLVEHGADINKAGEQFYGNTPLMAAIYFRMQEVVQYLVQQGALTEAFNADSASPLMYAAWFGDSATVQLLIDHNAKETINHIDKGGNSALHWASDVKIVELLLKNGADPTIRNNKGQTPLEQAREYNWKDKVAVLEKYMNADGNQKSEAAPEILPENQDE
jgi:ankyrin repeat protein